jgi:hypothetical protein
VNQDVDTSTGPFSSFVIRCRFTARAPVSIPSEAAMWVGAFTIRALTMSAHSPELYT